MAGLTNAGTTNTLANVPTGYTRPTVSTFTDWEWKQTVVLTVLKATVDEATAVATMAAIISNGTIGITFQVSALVTAAFDVAGATVTAYADWRGLTNNYASASTAGDHLKSTACSYSCTVDIYVKTA